MVVLTILSACLVASRLTLLRLHKEDAQRQHKDGDGHQQDAEAELPGKRLADMSDYIAHL